MSTQKPFERQSVIIVAVRCNSYNLIGRLEKIKMIKYEDLAYSSCTEGNLDMLTYAIQHIENIKECVQLSFAKSLALKHGHLDCVKFLDYLRIEWREELFSHIIEPNVPVESFLYLFTESKMFNYLKWKQAAFQKLKDKKTTYNENHDIIRGFFTLLETEDQQNS